MDTANGTTHPLRAGCFAVAALRRGGTGRVASVHRRAINLLFGDGSLIGLLPADRAIHPWAVSGVACDSGTIEERAPFEVTERVLVVGRTRLDLGASHVVDLRLTRRPVVLSARAADVVKTVDSRSNAGGRRPSEDPLVPVARDGLRARLTRGDLDPLVDLVGRGLGHTPSGDDILIGILAGLDLCRDCWAPGAYLRGQLFAALQHKNLFHSTTRLSAQLLSASAAGHYSEPLRDLLEAMAEVDQPTFKRREGIGNNVSRASVGVAAAALKSLGHHSGPATLRGLAAVMAAVKPAPEPRL